MSYINVVMSLKEFLPYVADILQKNEGDFFIEKRNGSGTILVEKVAVQAGSIDMEDNRGKNLDFFILSDPAYNLTQHRPYDDETAPFVIVGQGGRETADSIERIALRVLSKTPDKNTARIFNAIKNKLKKDDTIGRGIEGGSRFHDSYFYEKKYVGVKTMKTDFHNDKAAGIKIKQE
ncbi:hypothetical protein SAMN04488128_107193 [Chitinophaga eiseniae]|uniref:Uncharacterized protein n=1 Tax=Chitinophaga eiseniae TaxID=634771 RepID=A0A1T4U0W4_9BACT|nr:hypothetical protein [Chitinophaga eiseniae]SKA46139.1 hypothetical protein SAMN04488128_107193 [Chitinophaga eiseniae]